MRKTKMLFEDTSAIKRGESPPGTPWRGLWIVGMLFLLSRLVAWTGAYTGAVLDFRIQCGLDAPFEKHLVELREKLADLESPERKVWDKTVADFAAVTRFDGEHYESIIVEGYHYKPVGEDAHFNEREQNIAFFPIYPLLASGFTLWMTPQAALVLTANLMTLVAAVLFYLWVRRRVDEQAALFGLACLLFWPSAAYYSFGYAESTTLVLTVAMLYAVDCKRFWIGAICCGLATASRPTAAGLVPVFAIAYWISDSERPAKSRLLRLIPLGALAVSGMAAYAGFLWYEFGSPLVYFTNFRVGWTPTSTRASWLEYLTLARVWDQFKYFGRVLANFPVGLIELTNPFTWNMPLNFFVLFLSIAAIPRVPTRFRPLLLLGPFIFAQAYLASGGAAFGVEPISRYTAVAVPAFVVLGAWCTREWRPGYRYALLTFFVVTQAAWAIRYGAGEWSS